MVAFSIVLSKAGGRTGRQIALISNPITGAWSDRAAEEFDIPIEWLNNPNYDHSDMQRSHRRISAIMDYYVETSGERELGRIIGDVMGGLGLEEIQMVSPEMGFQLSQQIAHRVSFHLFNIPYSKQITVDEMRAALGNKKPD